MKPARQWIERSATFPFTSVVSPGIEADDVLEMVEHTGV
jgi:hypothetical protein